MYQQYAPYTCRVSGPGLHSATANHQTHIELELIDKYTEKPCLQLQMVTAELEYISETKPTSIPAAIYAVYASPYMVYYKAVSRGQHKLHIRVNDKEINESPFTITVYPDPTQLDFPEAVIPGLNQPYGIAFNSHSEIIVSERWSHQIAIFNMRQQRIREFGSRGNGLEHMNYPQGVAVDGMDNIYVSSWHKLQKFTNSGTLVKSVGQEGSMEGEFDDPYGITIYDNKVYVCDCKNDRIQVFDLNLNFIQSIGQRESKFYAPFNVRFDTAGYMYVSEFNKRRVQVLNSSGDFIRVFGEEGKGKLSGPSALHIVDQYVYVSDWNGDCIVVYKTSGQFVCSFGKYGQKKGEFRSPYSITSCAKGYIYICDRDNKRIQIF